MVRDYLILTKPGITATVVMTTWIGFVLASAGQTMDWNVLTCVLAGTALVAGGASTLNMVLEWPEDARMERTKHRPIPAGRIRPRPALVFGLTITAAGLGLMGFAKRPEASALALVNWLLYVAVYTPLKKKTSLCTIVGALPGALPPLIGWMAARGSLSPSAWLLFAILFLWQFPHFLSLAWMYREDYRQAGFQILSVLDPDGFKIGSNIVLYTMALLVMSLVPTLAGITNTAYFYSALVFGLIFLGLGVVFALGRKAPSQARFLFHASLIYLPALFVSLALSQKIPFPGI